MLFYLLCADEIPETSSEATIFRRFGGYYLNTKLMWRFRSPMIMSDIAMSWNISLQKPS